MIDYIAILLGSICSLLCGCYVYYLVRKANPPNKTYKNAPGSTISPLPMSGYGPKVARKLRKLARASEGKGKTPRVVGNQRRNRVWVRGPHPGGPPNGN